MNANRFINRFVYSCLLVQMQLIDRRCSTYWRLCTYQLLLFFYCYTRIFFLRSAVHFEALP